MAKVDLVQVECEAYKDFACEWAKLVFYHKSKPDQEFWQELVRLGNRTCDRLPDEHPSVQKLKLWMSKLVDPKPGVSPGTRYWMIEQDEETIKQIKEKLKGLKSDSE